MAQLSNDEFYQKWVPLLADNVFQEIDGPRFEQLLADVRDSFASAASQNAQPVAPAVNFDPVLRQLTATHPLGVAELEYNHNNGGFTAYAPVQVDDLEHPPGEWRFRVKADAGRNASQTTDSPKIAVKATTGAAGPLSITVNQISDASSAGRALLRAGTTDDQLAQLDYLHLVDYPTLVRVYGENGAVKYLLDRLKMLTQVVTAMVSPTPPAAPTNGRVDDTANTFAGNSNPLFAALGDYEIYYPGSMGNQPATNGRADLVGGVLTIRDLTGLIDENAVGIRVAGSGNRPASAWLTNTKAFTGAAVVTPPATTAPTVALTVQLQANGTYKFSATAQSTASVQGITIRVLLAADNAEVAVYGPSGAGSTSYITTRPALAAGDYLAIATASTATVSGSSDEVPFTVAASSGSTPGKGYQATYTDIIPADA